MILNKTEVRQNMSLKKEPDHKALKKPVLCCHFNKAMYNIEMTESAQNGTLSTKRVQAKYTAVEEVQLL